MNPEDFNPSVEEVQARPQHFDVVIDGKPYHVVAPCIQFINLETGDAEGHWVRTVAKVSEADC